MSNSTEILVEKLKLQRLLYERVFVKWEDESDMSCTLGSRLYHNKQNLNFFLVIYHDLEGCLHIHFSLKVSILVAGKKQEIEMLLVVPPDAEFTDPSKPNIDELSYLDASAIHDAEISDTICVLRIQFDLSTNGFIITKKRTNTTMKPWNNTSQRLIHGLESLSRTRTFTVYIKPNDYALVGIRELRNRFNKTGNPTDLHKPNMKEMYIGYIPELVEWSSDPISLPPVYTENRQLSPEVQVPRSPPIIFGQRMPSTPITEVVIAKTPAQTPTSPDSTSVHGIFSQESSASPSHEESSTSPSHEESSAPQPRRIISLPQPRRNTSPPRYEESSASSSHEETPDRFPTSSEMYDIFTHGYEELNHMDKASRYMDFNVDSDAEQLAKEQFAKLDSRVPNQQQIDHNLEVSQMLNSKFLKWLQTTIRINTNIQTHKRLATKLSILGTCIRTSNIITFDATLLWCSTLFFYDPLDSDPNNILGLWEKSNSWLISDIAKLIQWANGIHNSAEISPLLLNHFLELGNTARVVALDARHNKDKYYDQKCVCILHTLAEFSKPGVSEENSKSVFGKSLGTDSNVSKRVKM
ncbi:hypothetical protein ACMFMG_004954 [Clarireedia jacksonii]